MASWYSFLVLKFKQVPAFYDQTYKAFARRGARVLALGHAVLGALSHQQVRDSISCTFFSAFYRFP